VTSHLTPTAIEGYLAGALAGAHRAEVAIHLLECQVCRQQLDANPRFASKAATLRRAIEDGDEHPEFEALAAFVDGTLDQVARGRVNRHVAECETCAEDVADLSRLRIEVTRPEREVVTREPIRLDRAKRPAEGRTIRDHWPSLLAAAAAIVVVAGAVAWWRTQAPGNVASPSTAAVAPTPSRPERFAINDGATRISVGVDGSISGLDRLASADAAAVADTLRRGRLTIADNLAALRPRASQLMGASSSAAAFSLVRPVGTAVESQAPEFAWTSAPDATGYRVSVFDTSLNRVAESGLVTATRWTPSTPLARNRVYVWQVRAETAGGPVLAPGPERPEARFRLLDSDTAAMIRDARQRAGDSHLARAVIAARAGLVDDAANELQTLLDANPRSQLIESLQKQLRSLGPAQ